MQEIVGGRCLGHWRPTSDSEEYKLPLGLEIKDGERKGLAFVSTVVARDPDPPNDECYFFFCYDITLGPSSEMRLWKAEPKVAARVFGGFLNGHYDQSISRYGTEYNPGPINDNGTKSKGT